MITRIEAHNYRCFPALAVDLSRYHVLAGANGAGKTTLLDLPVLVGDMLRPQGITGPFLERQETGRSARASTFTDLLHKGQGDTIAFAFEARLPEQVTSVLAGSSQARLGRPVPTHLRYELQLEVTRRSIRVVDEYLFLFSDAGPRPAPGIFPQGRARDRAAGQITLGRGEWQSVIHRESSSPAQFTPETTTQPVTVESSAAQPVDLSRLRVPVTQLALGAVPLDETLFPAALWFASLLRGRAVYFDPVWDELRGPVPPGQQRQLTGSGQNLPWLALAIQESDPEEFASWTDHVRTALPQVKSIRVREREEDHFAYFAVEYEGGHQVTSSGLSDGTLKILALTLLSFLDEEAMPRLLVMEEPENGIHPQAIETVLQALTMRYDAQVLVSTHSPIVLAGTDLRDILVTRLDSDGAVSVVAGDKHPRLSNWRGAIDVGSLFAAGILS